MTATQDDTIAELQRTIAELRRERDERESERDAALAREAALAEILDLINRSPGDPGPVFSAILETAHTLCGADAGALMQFDGTNFRAVATHGLPDEFAAMVQQPFRGMSHERLIHGDRIVHVADARAVADWAMKGEVERAFVERTNLRTSLFVPLRKAGALLGFISADRHEVRPFTDTQISLLESFAAQAVIAIENARLLDELRQRSNQLTQRNTEYSERIEHQAATIDVLKAMSASPDDPQPVFDLIVERARDLCDAHSAGVYGFDGTLVQLRAATGVEDDPERRKAFTALYPRPPTRDFHPGRAILDRQIVRIDDAESEPGLSPLYRRFTNRSGVAVPLLRDGVAIGALGLGRRERGGFSDSQVALLQTFAEQAVIAITSAETYRALQTRTADLQETLEYQTATSDVLKVISRSTFDLQPVLSTLVETAARLCNADQAVIAHPEGDLWRLRANFGFPPEYEAYQRERGLYSLDPHAPNVSARAVRERRPVHIHDVAEVPGYPEIFIRLAKQRSSLGVPLLREGEAIGYIVLARQRVEPFTDRQIELVSTFADQAVIAIENARLITEQREALEQQTATAEVLQVINANPGNLAPVFDAMLEKAIRLCDTAYGIFATYNGDAFLNVAWRGVPPALAQREEFLGAAPIRPRVGALLYPLMHGEDVVHVADIKDDEFYRSGNRQRRALVDVGGARTVLEVALRKDNTLLGAINVFRQEVHPFTDKQIALLQTFAAQAVIAIENARLINEQREALERQTATAEVLQVINASPGDLAPVFDAILEKAHSLCGAAAGTLTTYDGGQMRAVATRGGSPAWAEAVRRPRPPGSNDQQIISGNRYVEIPDLQALAPAPVDDATFRLTRVNPGWRTLLIVPLRRDDAVLGYISSYRLEVRPFSDKEISLFESFAAQAVIAMENARLITEQREALERQTATAEVLQVINASPGNLAPVFDALLERALRFCESSFGILCTYDGEFYHTVAMRDMAPGYADLIRAPFRPGPGMFSHRLVLGKNIVHVGDITTDASYYDLANPFRRALADQSGARTAIWVALRRDDALIGMINIFRREVRPYSDQQIALLENFASHAVIAMENARLLSEQQEALEQQTATAEVLQVINASPGNLTPVFDAMLEKAMRLCGAACGGLFTYDGERFHTMATLGVPVAAAEFRTKYPPTAQPGSGIARLLRTRRTDQILDRRAEEDYWSAEPGARAMVELGGARTMLNVPLLKEDEVVGFFSVYRQEVRAFSEKQIALLENFAAQAVIAMENARLLDEIRQRQEELRVTFENMGDGVAMFDETQHLVAWNRKFQDILDVPDDIIARRQTFPEYVRYLAERGEYNPEADPEEHVRGLIEQAGQSRTYERTRPDGRVIEIRHNPVPSGGFVLIYADITERKRNEAEIRAARDAAEEASRTIEAAYRELKTAQANLIQAEKMASLGQLTAGIAHEIKNPLNFVNNFAALSVDLLSELKETAAPGFAALTDKQRAEVDEVSVMLTSNLEKITEHGKRADGIVKAMLEHSRGSSGERRMVDLNGLIDEALNLAYHGARAQDQSFNITLERDFGEGIAAIEVNPQDITRVFLNLFANGFYATTKRARDGGEAGFAPTLMVTTRDIGEAVEIRVWDNGTGIPADIRDKLFQPFFTTKPTGEGTGLGLSITYDIVTQQHGGSIAVDSKVGEYSEFMIQLPRYRP